MGWLYTGCTLHGLAVHGIVWGPSTLVGLAEHGKGWLYMHVYTVWVGSHYTWVGCTWYELAVHWLWVGALVHVHVYYMDWLYTGCGLGP